MTFPGSASDIFDLLISALIRMNSNPENPEIPVENPEIL
jgi:hypothetical protein